LNEYIIELESVESEKDIEVSHYQNEIKKLEQDIEIINEKLNQLMNNDILSPEAQQQYEDIVEF